MRPETVQGIIDAIASAWRLDKDAEITLEANPTSVEAERFRGYRSAGVNRLSIGVQALNDFDLKALGRKHTVVEALAAVRLAASLFPRSLSTSFMAGRDKARPLGGASSPRGSICRRPHLALSTDHRTGHDVRAPARRGQARAARRRAGPRPVPRDARIDLCARLPAYEVSNHARPGGESRHTHLWRYGEYAGVGPGAHGPCHGEGRMAQETERHPEMWLTRSRPRATAGRERAAPAGEEQGHEFLLMGLA